LGHHGFSTSQQKSHYQDCHQTEKYPQQVLGHISWDIVTPPAERGLPDVDSCSEHIQGGAICHHLICNGEEMEPLGQREPKTMMHICSQSILEAMMINALFVVNHDLKVAQEVIL
jgi:hypothetical protein